MQEDRKHLLYLFRLSSQDISIFSHLPDITIITPVFSRPESPNEEPEIIFFTASRGHHADVGGILPGSMPPTSVNISEEGAEIVSFKIVDGGRFNRKELWDLMVERPARFEGCSGCRNFKDVESDLKAVCLTFPFYHIFQSRL